MDLIEGTNNLFNYMSHFVPVLFQFVFGVNLICFRIESKLNISIFGQFRFLDR